MNCDKLSKQELIEQIKLLEEKNTNISNILDNVNEVYYKISYDKKGSRKEFFVSNQVKNVFGLSQQQYLKEADNLFEYFHPEDLYKLKEIADFRKSKLNETVVQYRFYNKELKKYVWINESIKVKYYKTGEKKEVYGSAKEITETKKRELQLEFLIDNIEECIYSVKFNEKDKELVFVSRSIYKLLGLREKEFIEEGKSGKLMKRCHPDDREIISKNIEENLYKNKRKNITTQFRFKPKGKNKYIWIEEKLYANYNKKGDLTDTTTVIRDITQEKESKELLKQSENKFKRLSNATNEVVIVHEKGIIKEVNDAAYKVFGYKPEELINKNAVLLAEEESKEKIKNNILLGYEKPYEVIGVKKNGERFFGEILGKNILWNNKKVRIVTIRDITELKKREEKLFENEQKLALTLKNIKEGIYSINFYKNKNREFTYASPQLKNMFGEDYYKFSKMTWEEKSKHYHPDDIDKIDSIKNEFKKRKKEIELTYRFKPKGKKEYLWLEEKVFPQYSEDGTLIANFGIVRNITETKTAEIHLKENEKRYRNIFSRNLAGVFRVSKEGIILDCNNSFAKIYGYKSRIQLLGKSILEFYYSKKQRQDYLKELNKYNKLTNYTIRNKTKEGKEVWLLANIYKRNENNKELIEGTILDVTDQIKNERLLTQSIDNFKNLIENAPYGIIIISEKGKILLNNIKALEIFEVDKKEEIDNNKIYEFLLPKYRKLSKERKNKVLKGEDVGFEELAFKKPKSKEIATIESKQSLIHYFDKKAIQIVFRDVSLRKELEKQVLKSKITEQTNKVLEKEIIERKKVEKELLENQKYTNSIIKSSLDVIIASDIKGNIIEFNDAATNTFGYSKKEILGKSVTKLYKTKKELLTVSKKLKEKGTYFGEVKNNRKNGEEFTSFLSASILYNEQGEPIGTMGVSRDITELKEAEKQLIESEERYRDLFENATDLIQSIDQQGKIIYVNKAWKKTLGYTDKEIQQINIFDIIHPNSIKHCETTFKRLLLDKTKNLNEDLSFVTKNGKKIEVSGSFSVKIDQQGKTTTRAILRDITEKKRTNKIQQVYNNITKIVSEKRDSIEMYSAIREELSNILNTDIFGISYLYNNNTITFPYFYDITRNGLINIEDRVNKKGLNEYFIKKKKPQILYKEDIKRLKKENKIEIYGPLCEIIVAVPLKNKNNIIGFLTLQSYKDKNAYNKESLEILKFISGALALTVQRKYDETKIYEQTARLQAIIENSSHLFWTYEKEKGLTSYNQNFANAVYDLYGEKIEKVLEKSITKKENQPFWAEKYEAAFKGNKIEFITEKENTKGERIIREVFLNPIFDEERNVNAVSGIAHDITEKKQSEEKLKESLTEKEVLLKEVHHRVKNNLQVISSILNLQSSYVKDINTLEILKESQNRIKSMAFIHESLYQTNNFSNINFSEYVINLSKNLVYSYGAYDNLVELKLDVKEVFLSLDTSIPCGLIINELITNALKYAFPKKQKGNIWVKLHEKSNIINLIIKDNGVGLPKDFDYTNSDSLGLQLVVTLAEQIEAKIKLNREKGTEFTISFNKY